MGRRPKEPAPNQQEVLAALMRHVHILTEVVKDLFQTTESIALPDGGVAFRESAFAAQYRYHAQRLFPKQPTPVVPADERIDRLESKFDKLMSILTNDSTVELLDVKLKPCLPPDVPREIPSEESTEHSEDIPGFEEGLKAEGITPEWAQENLV